MNRGDESSPRSGNGKSQFATEGGCDGNGAGMPTLGDRSKTKLADSEALFSAAPRLGRDNNWLIWQLVDSAFPTGGFAHSAGLEAAWQHGEVRGRQELDSFVESSLHQIGRALLPFVTAAYDEPERTAEFDELCEAFTTNHVANRASRAQGRAFLNAWRRIFADGRTSDDAAATLPFMHFAPVFGFCLKRLDVARDTTCRLFVFNHVRGLYAAAVRLNIVGPMEAQAAQFEMSNTVEAVLSRCVQFTLDDLAQTSPLLEIWQGSQDRLYSRLFQS